MVDWNISGDPGAAFGCRSTTCVYDPGVTEVYWFDPGTYNVAVTVTHTSGVFTASMDITVVEPATATPTATSTPTNTPEPTATPTATSTPVQEAVMEISNLTHGEIEDGAMLITATINNIGKDPIVEGRASITFTLDGTVVETGTFSPVIPNRGSMEVSGTVIVPQVAGTHTVCVEVGFLGLIYGPNCTEFTVIGKIYLPMVMTPPMISARVILTVDSCPGTAQGFAQIPNWTGAYWGNETAMTAASGQPRGVLTPTAGQSEFTFQICIHPINGLVANGADAVLRSNGQDNWDVTQEILPLTVYEITVQKGNSVHLVDRPTR
ncbi:hypothetical protein COX05_03440 [candidate division WWE3 bacterium CG22_combo_CG10-13_8_21_14_all_39_12]|uniref:PKD domain-containing protein n=1 Tax=candidate division WWE3 bacterium CG22_combo_CG10-13_8_21_14_all_39_12 TaxID=1975094 RepID=A0A2H0BFA6_UNCKA|nr:MAG: hypothetical protein COX05_03440 [candidate division WWE3 bacterium CG22_combo_CG10-13_8_21_14_all_39_12]